MLMKTPKDTDYIIDNNLYVCIGGSSERAKIFAHSLSKNLFGIDKELDNISEKTDRYVMYKTGPILHGIGESSTSIMLYELFKLFKFAKCVDPLIIRIGTCGGLGLDPGTVVITQKAYDGFLREFLSIVAQTIHV
ncbi:uridine phosphorylase 1-like [Octopus sinensis]|uniref:Uridine phosphorylase 1-like n=1 Tax=Octopus sinensis TaxID=2607531 RepID=A0A7E6EMK5_9MOLL|nr:uridine phosphorylase 1-like [Octopus sinensis]